MENLYKFSRTEIIFGKENLEKLSHARVAVFGLGGVGSYTVEALARSGIGTLDLIDNDVISVTNINRQLYALHSTIGMAKVEVAKNRILDINPDCKVNIYKTFFLPENSLSFDFKSFSYVADCIDTVTGKIEIITQCKKNRIPVISSMGTGNKMNPSLFEIADISKTSVCPLARVMRHELKMRNIEDVKVLYSKEKVCVARSKNSETENTTKPIPGSNSFTPSVAGLLIAAEIIKDLVGFTQEDLHSDARE